MSYKMLKDPVALVLLLIAAVALPSSIWMLLTPYHWYQTFPGKIPDFGDFNVHFVRDLGSAYFAWSIACIWAARTPAVRVPVVGITTLFFLLHAVIHVFDTLRGHVHSEHFLLDFPSTYLPVLLLFWVLIVARRKQAE